MKDRNLKNISNIKFSLKKKICNNYNIIILIFLIIITFFYYNKYVQQQYQIKSFRSQIKEYNINDRNLNRYLDISNNSSNSKLQKDTYYNNRINKINKLSSELKSISPNNEIYSQRNIKIFDIWKQELLSYLSYFKKYEEISISLYNNRSDLITNPNLYKTTNIIVKQNYYKKESEKLIKIISNIYKKLIIENNNWNKVALNYKSLI